jgi:hypothetical protein
MLMQSEDEDKLIRDLKGVLKENDRGEWTVPATYLYPHQWLWDSCFIAIGLRHVNVKRAQKELESLLRGQWSNGMLPHIILNSDPKYARDKEIERGYLNPYSPHDVATSGLTQPPMLAEAVLQVGKKLPKTERRSWYKKMYPALLRYHEWLYKDRDPHSEGLVLLLHPYECGLDNTPPWISEMRKHSMPWWILSIERLHLDGLVNFVRRDTRHVPPGQRMSNIEAMGYWAAMRRLRRKAYNSEAILSRSLFAVEDLSFNCILIRANDCLAEIAKDIGRELPYDLSQNAAKTKKALEMLWDDNTSQYYSRSFISHKLIEEPTIATFMPLYTGAITKEKAQHLVNLLKKRRTFATQWPVPSVPLSSSYFDPYKYWQGPTWINTNWLIIEGLKRYGFNDEAEKLAASSIKLVARSGPWEYFNPLDGSPAGAENFSWTAALAIDLLKR